jgi:hypothetical protein
MAFLTTEDAATSICVVPPPMTIVPFPALMPFIVLMPLRSMTSFAEASPCFIVGNSVWPPPRYLPSLDFFMSASAAFTVAGR